MSWATIPGRSKFQTKVVLSVVTVMVTLVAVIMWVMNQHFTRHVRNQAQKTLQSAHTVFRDSRDFRANNLLLPYLSITSEPRFRAVFQLADPKTIEVLLSDILEEFHADMIMFTSAQKNVLAFDSIDSDLSAGNFEASIPIAMQIMEEGEPGMDIVLIEGRLFELFLIPIRVGGTTTGVLSFANEFGDRVIEEFMRLTGSEIIFHDNGKVAASSIATSVRHQSILDIVLRQTQGTDSPPSPDKTAAQLLSYEDNYFVSKLGTFESADVPSGRRNGSTKS